MALHKSKSYKRQGRLPPLRIAPQRCRATTSDTLSLLVPLTRSVFFILDALPFVALRRSSWEKIPRSPNHILLRQVCTKDTYTAQLGAIHIAVCTLWEESGFSKKGHSIQLPLEIPLYGTHLTTPAQHRLMGTCIFTPRSCPGARLIKSQKWNRYK